MLLLEDIKRASEPVLKNGSARVWDIGDGVLCFEFTSKSNSLDEGIMALLGKTIALVKEKYKALVIYNEGQNFSVGANLGPALFAANIAAWGEIEKAVATGQTDLQKLKYAPFPAVCAPAGMALGGGCEILLHSTRCRRMPRAISAWSSAASGCCRVGAAARRCWRAGPRDRQAARAGRCRCRPRCSRW